MPRAVEYSAEDLGWLVDSAARLGAARTVEEVERIVDQLVRTARSGPEERRAVMIEAISKLAASALASVQRFAVEHDARCLAEAESRAKDEFLSTLGHELRNPLAPIVTVLSLIKLRGPDPFERERQIIERQVDHLVGLVDDLLDVSRIARGAIQLRRAPVELAWIVARALESAGPAIAERGHEIRVDVPATGLAIDADVDRFTQVIANLMSNAAKYTPRGGRIEVLGDVEGHCARLVVRDTGIGIDNATLPHLFELFAQHRPRVTEREAGLGLGLSLVRSIVELHGGVVSAASEGPGRGAAFTVRVPLVSAADHEAHLARGTRPLRVLVVDDNIDAAETLGDLLAVMGHDAVVVHDASSALEKLATFVPEVAFLDIGLPVMDGFALAECMRARPELANAPLIAVTAYGRDADRQRTRAAGFTEHLVKPLSADKLRSVLDKL